MGDEMKSAKVGQGIAFGVGVALAAWMASSLRELDVASRLLVEVALLLLPSALRAAWTAKPLVEDRWDLLLLSPGLGAIAAVEARRSFHLDYAVGLMLAMILAFAPLVAYVARRMRRGQS
jgi:hypothetical protein